MKRTEFLCLKVIFRHTRRCPLKQNQTDKNGCVRLRNTILSSISNPGILILLWHHPGIRMFELPFFYRNNSTLIEKHFLAQKWHSRILITILLNRNLNAKHEILRYTMRKIQIICYHNSLWSVQVAIDHEPLLLILKSNIDKPDWKGQHFFTLGSFIIL